VAIPNLIQVFPELHFSRVGADFVQIRSQEHFSMQYLRALLVRCLIYWTLETGAPGCESASCDIEFKKFLVHDIDHGRYQSFDIFGTVNQRRDVICAPISFEREVGCGK